MFSAKKFIILTSLVAATQARFKYKKGSVSLGTNVKIDPTERYTEQPVVTKEFLY